MVLLLTWFDDIHGFTNIDVVLNKCCSLARGKDLIRTGKSEKTKALSTKIVTSLPMGYTQSFEPILCHNEEWISLKFLEKIQK